MSPLSPAAAAAPPDPPAADSAPTKKPRGNPTLHLIPRCGARTRSGCACRGPAIHGKLRCRMHGGRSTGPRTPKGIADLRAARTIHGHDGAEARALDRCRLTTMRRARIDAAAHRYQAHLPPAFVARLHGFAPELMPPPRPTGGITAAMDRMRRRAVAAALAPWKQAIAEACAAERAARAAARLAKAHAPVGARPPRGAGVPGPHAPIPGAADPATAARLTKTHAPVGARSPHGAGVPEPRAPIPSAAVREAAERLAKTAAPVGVRPPRGAGVAGPRAPIPGAADPEAAGRLAKPDAPVGARSPHGAGVPGPHVPIHGAADPEDVGHADCPPKASAASSPADATQGGRPTPPRPAGQNPLAAAVAKPLAPNRAPTQGGAGVAELHAPIPGPAAPAVPPGLPNRAARRRWKSLQRRKHRAPAAGARA